MRDARAPHATESFRLRVHDFHVSSSVRALATIAEFLPTSPCHCSPVRDFWEFPHRGNLGFKYYSALFSLLPPQCRNKRTPSRNNYDIARKLGRPGIPDPEIVFIQDYDSDATKLTLFRDVRAGKVRVLFGSTQKMGSETNVQERLIVLHHLDAPWRPADVEQREGRILRQGNKTSVVQIFRYVTEGSFDAYMWQTLETKAKFIAQVMSGDMTIRRL